MIDCDDAKHVLVSLHSVFSFLYCCKLNEEITDKTRQTLRGIIFSPNF